MQAVQSRTGSNDRGGASPDRRIAIHDDSWYLGDGGFAARHMEDEERMAAKKVRERGGMVRWAHGVLFVCLHLPVVMRSSIGIMLFLQL